MPIRESEPGVKFFFGPSNPIQVSCLKTCERQLMHKPDGGSEEGREHHFPEFRISACAESSAEVAKRASSPTVSFLDSDAQSSGESAAAAFDMQVISPM